MAVWLPTGTLYLPPAQPVSRVLQTDDYIRPTSVFFHGGSERLLTVGHPYFPITDTADPTKVTVPKVSANQYRVFRVRFPDPNKFALIDTDVYDPTSERLVWRLRGIEVGRGGPIGIGTTGHPLFNKAADTENPSAYPVDVDDERQNVSFDPKQSQILIVGCAPAVGQHWDRAKACAGDLTGKGDCPPLELRHTIIEDGDMGDIGFGAMNFKELQQDKAGVPLELVTSTSKWPDFLKMSKDIYGDSAFFFGRREQVYARHMFVRNGTVGDKIPGTEDPNDYYVNPDPAGDRKTIAPSIYFPVPSGSLASSESNLFSRPYWLQRSQGTNNGILWGNQMFITLLDNTHGTTFTLSITAEDDVSTYKATNYKNYLRHTEEFEIEAILQLCVVPLTAEILGHLNVMNPGILEDWNLTYIPPAPTGIEDTYRYLSSLATKCPDQVPKDKEDPYAKYSFWEVDLTEKLSSELTQFSLGRRFIFQTGLMNGSTGTFKRVRTPSSTRKKTVKRRKVQIK